MKFNTLIRMTVAADEGDLSTRPRDIVTLATDPQIAFSDQVKISGPDINLTYRYELVGRFEVEAL